MKAPKIIRAMGHLDDDLIMDAMEEKLIPRKSSRPFRRFISFAAVLILLVSIGAIQEWRSGQSGSSMPNPLAVYAMDIEGNLTPNYLKEHESEALDQIELETGLKGFLFSCRLDDPKAQSLLHMLNFSSTPTPDGVEELYKILEDRGQCYFYFTPPENEQPPYKITCRGDTGEGQIMTYKLLIEWSNDGYAVTVLERSIEHTGVGLWN